MDNETTDFIRQRIEADLADNTLAQGVITRFPRNRMDFCILATPRVSV